MCEAAFTVREGFAHRTVFSAPARVMNLFNQSRVNVDATLRAIEIVEPAPEDCPTVALPPEGNVKTRNYRMLNENLCAYSPTGDVNTSPSKGKLVSKYDVYSTLSPPRQKILELLRPEDPGREALEAIVRPAPRRGLARPFDEDTRRFLQRALLSPSPQISTAGTPEPHLSESKDPDQKSNEQQSIKSERSLADELKEAEEDEKLGGVRRDLLRELRKRGGGVKEAMERERMGKLALSVEQDEDEDCGLSAAARRLDVLLAESRNLHEELAGIHEDIQADSARARRCAAAARLLTAESCALRYLDDVVALLNGNVAAAARARAWPFALGRREPTRNYII